jgi:hypothetical protein
LNKGKREGAKKAAKRNLVFAAFFIDILAFHVFRAKIFEPQRAQSSQREEISPRIPL